MRNWDKELRRVPGNRSTADMVRKASYGLTTDDMNGQKDVELSENYEPVEKTKITSLLVFSVIGAVFGSFQFGYNLGVINNPEKSIKEFMNETEFERTGNAMPENTIKNLWSLAVSIYALGGCFGGFFGGWVAEKIGRKSGNLSNAVFGLVCSAMLFASKRAATYELFIVGRFLIGIHAGIYTAITPLFLSEISPTNIRGAVGVLHQLAVVTGLLVAQVLGFHIVLGTRDLWDVLVGLAAVPCLAQILILSFCPASPRFLMITRKNEDECKRALIKLRGTREVQEEMDEMKKEMDIQTEKTSIFQLFLRPSLRKPLIIGIVMHLSQQFGGVNGVFFYSTSLFEDIGLSAGTASYTTSAVGGIMVTMTLVSVPLMDRAGRRTLHLVGLGGMFIFGILITIALNLRADVDPFKYIAVVVTLCYVVFFAIGPGSIPWLIVAELFTHESRSAALSICTLVNWMASFIIGYIFPFVQEGLGDNTFVPFIVLLALFFLFTFFKLPETKNKTFEEVTSLWKGDDVVSYSGNGLRKLSDSSSRRNDGTELPPNENGFNDTTQIKHN